MFSTKSSSIPPKYPYFEHIGTTNTSKVSHSSMSEPGKVSFGGYVSEK